MNDETLLICATEFVVGWHGETIHISRYDNHARLMRNGGWGVCSWKNRPYGDSTNPWYLGVDGVWRYKNGVTFKTPQEALRALESACPPGTNGWHQRAENAYEKAAEADATFGAVAS